MLIILTIVGGFHWFDYSFMSIVVELNWPESSLMKELKIIKKGDSNIDVRSTTYD